MVHGFVYWNSPMICFRLLTLITLLCFDSLFCSFCILKHLPFSNSIRNLHLNWALDVHAS